MFAPGRLRDASEQEAVLVQTVTRKRAARAVVPTAKMRYDAQSDTLIINRQRVPVSSICEALAASIGDGEAGEEEGKSVLLKISDEQHRCLRIRAAESGSSMAGLVKMALRRARLI